MTENTNIIFIFYLFLFLYFTRNSLENLVSSKKWRKKNLFGYCYQCNKYILSRFCKYFMKFLVLLRGVVYLYYHILSLYTCLACKYAWRAKLKHFVKTYFTSNFIKRLLKIPSKEFREIVNILGASKVVIQKPTRIYECIDRIFLYFLQRLYRENLI